MISEVFTGFFSGNMKANDYRNEEIECFKAFIDLFSFVNFASELDASVFYAALLTAVTGSLFETSPAIAITASDMSNGEASGSGKGLLLDAIAIFATGRASSVVDQGTTASQMARGIDRLRVDNERFIPIDNVMGPVDGARLNTIVAQRSSRIKLNNVLHERAAPFVVLTGNDLLIEGDFRRRVLKLEIKPHDTANVVNGPQRLSHYIYYRDVLVSALWAWSGHID